jgi:hypothetical protein
MTMPKLTTVLSSTLCQGGSHPLRFNLKSTTSSSVLPQGLNQHVGNDNSLVKDC